LFGSFGSKVISPKTGVIFNNQMADFSSPGITGAYGIPPSKANRIAAGKRPVSSKSSAIVIDNSGDVRLVIGGTGGTHMISGIANVCHYVIQIIRLSLLKYYANSLYIFRNLLLFTLTLITPLAQ